MDAKAWMMSMSNMPVKAASALTAGLVGWGLALAGFDATLTTQPDSVIFLLKACCTLIPAVGYGLASFFFSLYPINDKKAAEIEAQITAKAQ